MSDLSLLHEYSPHPCGGGVRAANGWGAVSTIGFFTGALPRATPTRFPLLAQSKTTSPQGAGESWVRADGR